MGDVISAQLEASEDAQPFNYQLAVFCVPIVIYAVRFAFDYEKSYMNHLVLQFLCKWILTAIIIGFYIEFVKHWLIVADAIANVIFVAAIFWWKIHQYHWQMAVALILSIIGMVTFGVLYLLHEKELYIWLQCVATSAGLVLASVPGMAPESNLWTVLPGQGKVAPKLRPTNANEFGW